MAALAGVLWGLPESELPYRLMSLALAASWHIKAFFSRGERRHPLLFLFMAAAILFFAGAVRARIESRRLSEQEAFYKSYEATNPGQFDYALYLKGEGISSEEELNEKYNGYSGDDPLKRGISDLKKGLASIIERYMSPEDAGIYKAVLLGDKTDMDDGIKELYQASGISHIIAVSGLHISLIGMSLFKLMRAIHVPLKGSAFVSGLFSMLYVSLTGSSGSAMRALIMLICRFAALSRSRSYDMVTAIALALLLLIFQRPYIVLQSGFQLSFLAVFGISFFGGELAASLERLRKRKLPAVMGTVFSNLSVQLMTLPAIAFHFFVFPIYGIFLNFIVIPLMNFVMYSGIAVLMLGALSDCLGASKYMNMAAALAEQAAVAAGGLGHYILKLYELLCSLISSLPGNRIILGRPKHISILLYYGLILAALYMLGLCSKQGFCIGKCQLLDRLNIKRTASALLMALSIIFCPLLLYRRPVSEKGLSLIALDVEQGDCFIVRTGDSLYMFDGGSASNESIGEDVLEAYLMNEGIRYIDKIFVSHGDDDHVNGIKYLLSEESLVEVGELILPKAAKEGEDYEELKELFEARGEGQIGYSERYMLLGLDIDDKKEPLKGDEDRAGIDADIGTDSGTYIDALKGRLDKANGNIIDDSYILCLYEGNTAEPEMNRHSPVYLLRYGDFSAVFTGDMTEDEEKEFYLETEGLREELLPYGATVVKAAHHGSKTSNSDILIKAVRPAFALISYGRDNSFGHPHSVVLERFERYGIETLGTGELGAIRLRTDGEKLSIDTYLH